MPENNPLIRALAKAKLSATIDCGTGEFDSEFIGSPASLTVLLGACIAHIAKSIGEGDPANALACAVKMSSEATKFALEALEEFEEADQEGDDDNA